MLDVTPKKRIQMIQGEISRQCSDSGDVSEGWLGSSWFKAAGHPLGAFPLGPQLSLTPSKFSAPQGFHFRPGWSVTHSLSLWLCLGRTHHLEHLSTISLVETVEVLLFHEVSYVSHFCGIDFFLPTCSVIRYQAAPCQKRAREALRLIPFDSIQFHSIPFDPGDMSCVSSVSRPISGSVVSGYRCEARMLLKRKRKEAAKSAASLSWTAWPGRPGHPRAQEKHQTHRCQARFMRVFVLTTGSIKNTQYLEDHMIIWFIWESYHTYTHNNYTYIYI